MWIIFFNKKSRGRYGYVPHAFHFLCLIPYCISPLLESTVRSYPCPKEKCKYGRMCVYIFLIYTCTHHIHTHPYIWDTYMYYIHIIYNVCVCIYISHIPWEVEKRPQFNLVRDIPPNKIIPIAFSSPRKMLPFSHFFPYSSNRVTALKGCLLSSAVFLLVHLKTA